MTITDGLRAWLNNYEGLAGDRINVDCLPDRLASYSLDSDPSWSEKSYMDGTRAVERIFVFSSREAWGEDIMQNTEVLEWYENLSRWVWKQSRCRNFPDLGEGRTVSSVAVVSAPYPFSTEENGPARYQVQIKLNYYEE